MKNVTRDIARSGMRGRKKDTVLLCLVLTLTFLFTVVTTILQASFTETEVRQRQEMFGYWTAAYYGANEEATADAPGLWGGEMCQSTFIGTSSAAGIIGTLSPEFIKMGGLALYEGTWPSAPDELVIEQGQVNYSDKQQKVGDRLEYSLSRLTINLGSDEMGAFLKAQPDELHYTNDYGWENMPLLHIENRFYEENGITVFVSSEYISYAPAGSDGNFIMANGLLYKQMVTLRRDMTISGIMQSVSSTWEKPKGVTLPTAFITDESGELFRSAAQRSALFDMSNYPFSHNLYFDGVGNFDALYNGLKKYAPEKTDTGGANISTDYGGATEFTLANGSKTYVNIIDDEDAALLVRNTRAYPEATGTTKHALVLIILTVIFALSAAAIFQIFLTQIKRRTRKISLLKSIGATNGQVCSVLLWEGVFLTAICLPLGTILGFGASYATVLAARGAGRGSMLFFVDWKYLLIGLCFGVLALLIGMLVPVIRAMKTPLTGNIEKPPKHIAHEHSDDGNAIAKQTYGSVCRRHLRVNRGKALVSFGIGAIIITISVLSLFLGFVSFSDYIDMKQDNRPDYKLEMLCGLRQKTIGEKISELEAIPGVTSVEAYKKGEGLRLFYDGIENDPTLAAFKAALPQGAVPIHFGGTQGHMDIPAVDDGIVTTLYGIDPESPLYLRFLESLDTPLDKSRFANGQDVIVLMPNYFPAGKTEMTRLESLASYPKFHSRMSNVLEDSSYCKTTFSPRYEGYYSRNTAIKAGDELWLCSDKEQLVENTVVHKFMPQKVNVGGVINSFKGGGLYPFSEDRQGYAVVCSFDMLVKLYPGAYGPKYDPKDGGLSRSVQLLYPTKLGRSMFYVYCDNAASAVTDSKILAVSDNMGATVTNYREGNSQVFAKALNGALLTGAMGLVAALIALIILYNTIVSKEEQEAPRTGVLQSIGVQKSLILRRKLWEGVVNGAGALLIAHAVLAITLLFTSMGAMGDVAMSFSGYIRDMFFSRLWMYPWWAHIGICLIFLLVCVIIRVLPAAKILKRSPMENIRS